MPVLSSRIDPNDAQFQSNRAAQLRLVEEFRAAEKRVRDNSGKQAEKFARRGQLLPRDRVARLLDRGAPFLELSTLAGLNMHDDDGKGDASGGGCIVGTALGADHCENWTFGMIGKNGAYGFTTTTDATWTDAGGTLLCSAASPIYCVEDPSQ